MTKIIAFAKQHWLGLIILVLILSYFSNQLLTQTYSSKATVSTAMVGGAMPMADLAVAPSVKSIVSRQVTPSESTNRLVIENTSLSLVVKDVANSIEKIDAAAKSLGGYMVNSYLSKPESAASGNITVRVPSDQKKAALLAFKEMSVKVVSESVSGDDVTDEYTDIEANLAILNQTKTKYQEIMDKAVKVEDLLSVQREMVNLQSQIDSLKGQQKYYEQSAKLTKITAYLSTDELALPYAPTTEWRPTLIFKQAVRSLVGTARSLGGLVIWLVVYSPIMIVAIIVIILIRRRSASKSKS